MKCHMQGKTFLSLAPYFMRVCLNSFENLTNCYVSESNVEQFLRFITSYPSNPSFKTLRKFNIIIYYYVLKQEATFLNQEQSTQIKTCILQLRNRLKQN